MALKRKDIHAFRQIIDTNKVDLEEIGDDDYLSIFNITCQSPDYHEFIEECLEYGCDVNRVSKDQCVLDVQIFFYLNFNHFS